MLPLIEEHRTEIAEICRRFGVQRLDVFGSAARVTDFDPARSDVDFLLTYLPGCMPGMDGYLDLSDELSGLLGYKVDLVMAGAVRNPIVKADIERWKEPLYAT